MLDLTAPEVIRLVQALKAMPESAMITNEQGELTFWINDEHTITLWEKIQKEGDREDVKQYMEKHYA